MTYAIYEDQSVFVTARRGFNSGGGGVDFATGTSYFFEPEYANTYELGYRGALLNGKSILAGTAFYNDYQGYQAFVFGTGGNPFDFVVVNTDGSSYGLEVEVRMELSETFRAFVGLGILETVPSDKRSGHCPQEEYTTCVSAGV